jgi:hypothetical protein
MPCLRINAKNTNESGIKRSVSMTMEDVYIVGIMEFLFNNVKSFFKERKEGIVRFLYVTL